MGVVLLWLLAVVLTLCVGMMDISRPRSEGVAIPFMRPVTVESALYVMHAFVITLPFFSTALIGLVIITAALLWMRPGVRRARRQEPPH